MKHVIDSNSTPRPLPNTSLLMSACASMLFLAGCSGFMGPDARMGRPDPQLLSSRGGQLPQPGTLGAKEPSAAGRQAFSPQEPFEPEMPGTSSETENPYVTSIEPLDDDFDSSPEMDEDLGDSPPIREQDMDEDAHEDTEDEERLPSPPETEPALSHRVQKGESLWTISRKYDVSVDELASYNDMDKDDVLRAGVALDIPPGGTPPADGQETAPSTRDDRSRDTESSAPSNGSSAATPDAEKDIPEDGKYIVRSGDSLWKISRRFGVSIDNLRDWNDLESDVLQVGRVILLRPDADEDEAATDDDMRPPRGREEEPDWEENEEPEQQTEGDDEEAAAQDRNNDDAGADDDTETVDIRDFPQTLDHTVSRTDTLKNIAAMYETSVQAIKQANPGVKTDDDLEYGMELVIPFE
ncbi:MAG: LysM peptidoglycan-binding domain-containing protein [Verrucomicrobiota bacterium]